MPVIKWRGSRTGTRAVKNTLRLKSTSSTAPDTGNLKLSRDDKELAYCLENKVELDCVDKNMNNALHLVTANGHADSLAILLEAFKQRDKLKEIDAKNSAGNTPLRRKA